MLSTSDNPFNPFTQFDEWYAYDRKMGYNTLGYLARMTISSYSISEADQQLAIQTAIDEIVEENVNGLYIKVTNVDS